MNICKFVEGSFIPSFDGASQRFYQISKNLSNLGVNLTIVHCYRGWSDLNTIKSQKFTTYAVSPKYYYHNYKIIDKIIQIVKPDIIEMNDMELLMSTGLYINRKFKIPLIYEAHFVSSILTKKITRNNNTVSKEKLHEEMIFRIVSGTTCFTKTDKINLIDSGKGDPKRIKVIPLGSDFNTVKFRKLSKNDNAILFLGNMYFQPNQDAIEDILNNIAPLVFKKNKNLIFKFIGDVPIPIKNKYQNNRIVFYGRVKDINKAFEKTRICIAPVTTGGGMRVKILTYMASGIPIISTMVAADGIKYNKFLNLADNSVEFANKIIEVANDLPRSICQGKQAYLQAKKNHSWREIAKKNISFYKSILKKPIFSSLDPIKCKTEPFWLTETIEKGRFKKKKINSENIYILGYGKRRILKSDSF